MTKVSGTAPKADFLTALAKVELRPSMRHTTIASLSSQLSSLGQTQKSLEIILTDKLLIEAHHIGLDL